MQITGVKPISKLKKVPGHPLLDEKDDAEVLSLDEASQYCSCVGILFYLATDLPHCQHTIRWLSTDMATPTFDKEGHVEAPCFISAWNERCLLALALQR